MVEEREVELQYGWEPEYEEGFSGRLQATMQAAVLATIRVEEGIGKGSG